MMKQKQQKQQQRKKKIEALIQRFFKRFCFLSLFTFLFDVVVVVISYFATSLLHAATSEHNLMIIHSYE